MSYEDDLREVFGDRAGSLPQGGRVFLKRLWEAGRRHGGRERSVDFQQGRNAGLAELSVLFTEVIRGLPVNEVFQEDGHDPHNGQVNLKLQPWVMAKLQDILDAPDLDSARAVAKESSPEHPPLPASYASAPPSTKKPCSRCRGEGIIRDDRGMAASSCGWCGGNGTVS